MHKLIANILCNEGNFDQARQHYLLSKDGIGCGTMLVEISQKKGYSNEVDLIIAQVVFQLLCLKEKSTAIQTFNTYVEKHPKIQQQKPPFQTPLLNFLYFMMVLMDEANKLVKFNALCKLYKPTLDRDVAYEKQIQIIKEGYFGAQQLRQQAGEGGILGQFINNLFNQLEDSDDDTETAQQQRTEVVDLD